MSRGCPGGTPMRYAAKFALIAVYAAANPARSPGQQFPIPKPSDGYTLTKTDAAQMAPSGYEGRTDVATQTLVGNTPATAGKRYVMHFTLGNKIKTCPRADGSSEGEGVFSVG